MCSPFLAIFVPLGGFGRSLSELMTVSDEFLKTDKYLVLTGVLDFPEYTFLSQIIGIGIQSILDSFWANNRRENK